MQTEAMAELTPPTIDAVPTQIATAAECHLRLHRKFHHVDGRYLHLAAISAKVAAGRHAALLLDQAGWHMSKRLMVPANVTIVALPAKCTELNPQENVWQFMRDNWLSNRVFTCYENIVDHCAEAWNKLEAQPWRVTTIGLRTWAQEF